MLELMLCSMLTLVPDFLFRRFVQGKRLGREITLFSVWYELRWGITTCLILTVLLITVVLTLATMAIVIQSGKSISTRMNLVNIGNAQILTIPGEALPNIGYYLKRHMKGDNNLLFGLTNDAFGYILTRVDFNSFQRYEYVSRTSLGEMTGEIYMNEALKLVLESPVPEKPAQ